jgi:hypothetical protein
MKRKRQLRIPPPPIWLYIVLGIMALIFYAEMTGLITH